MSTESGSPFTGRNAAQKLVREKLGEDAISDDEGDDGETDPREELQKYKNP